MKSLIEYISNTRVSSVLNRDVKQFGKKYMFDGEEETCWNSDQGSPQFIQVEFTWPVRIQELHIKFQGGFVGKDCHVELCNSEGQFEKVADFFPEDVNSLQIFKLPLFKTASNKLKIAFKGSTDFFGRITIYKLDILGYVNQ